MVLRSLREFLQGGIHLPHALGFLAHRSPYTSHNLGKLGQLFHKRADELIARSGW